jgi:hypothetical protein
MIIVENRLTDFGEKNSSSNSSKLSLVWLIISFPWKDIVVFFFYYRKIFNRNVLSIIRHRLHIQVIDIAWKFILVRLIYPWNCRMNRKKIGFFFSPTINCIDR